MRLGPKARSKQLTHDETVMLYVAYCRLFGGFFYAPGKRRNVLLSQHGGGEGRTRKAWRNLSFFGGDEGRRFDSRLRRKTNHDDPRGTT